MKAIVVMYDSLNRHYLSAYGCDWTHTPNFARLADRCATFDNHYVGSLPCIPARRELHTGRYNFLHRSWGPLEPYDDSAPELLKRNGVYTHLCTDHMHYFEEGGATYHQRYNSWELARGQEGDPWKANVREGWPGDWRRYHEQDLHNRTLIRDEADFPITQTFDNGLAFLDHNHAADSWCLSIETFDPHEPFYVPERYKALYAEMNSGAWPDWPTEGMTPQEKAQTRFAYMALVSMCDANLGRLLDKMDEHDLWDDTMLILCTDHGFLLGEHDGALGKVPKPYYRQASNTPFFVWDPRSRATGRRQALTQTIDIAPTLLDFFGVPVPEAMLGRPLAQAVRADTPVRNAALFGVHSHSVCLTDGRHIYVRAVRDAEANPCYEYTMMPTHMHAFFSVEALRQAELAAPFAFTKGVRPLRVPAEDYVPHETVCEDMIFDLVADPAQNHPIRDAQWEVAFAARMRSIMEENDAPQELYARLGL